MGYFQRVVKAVDCQQLDLSSYMAGPEEEWFCVEAVGPISPSFIELYLKAKGLF